MEKSCIFCNENITAESLFQEATYVSSDLRTVTTKCSRCGKTFEVHLFKAGVICSKLGQAPTLTQENLIPIPVIAAVKKADGSGVEYTLKDESGKVIFHGVIPFYKANYTVTPTNQSTSPASSTSSDSPASQSTAPPSSNSSNKVNSSTQGITEETKADEDESFSQDQTESEIEDESTDSQWSPYKEKITENASLVFERISEVLSGLSSRKKRAVALCVVLAAIGIIVLLNTPFSSNGNSSQQYAQLLPISELGDGCLSEKAYIGFSTYTSKITDDAQPNDHIAFLRRGKNNIHYYSVIFDGDEESFIHQWYKNGELIKEEEIDPKGSSKAIISSIDVDATINDVFEVVVLDEDECFVGREPLIVSDEIVGNEGVYSPSRSLSNGDSRFIHYVRNNDVDNVRSAISSVHKYPGIYETDYIGKTPRQIALDNDFNKIIKVMDKYKYAIEQSDKKSIWRSHDADSKSGRKSFFDGDSRCYESYPKKAENLFYGGYIYWIRNLLRECNKENILEYWLKQAVYRGNESVVLYLLSMGANPNFKAPKQAWQNRYDADKEHLFGVALRSGNHLAASQLVVFGFNPNTPVNDFKYSPISYAVEKCYFKPLKLLIDKGVDIMQIANKEEKVIPSLVYGCPDTKRWQDLKTLILSKANIEHVSVEYCDYRVLAELLDEEFDDQQLNKEKLAIDPKAINSCPDIKKWQKYKERVISETDVKYIIEKTNYDADLPTVSKMLNDYYSRYPICIPISKPEKIDPVHNADNPNKPYVYKANARENYYRSELEEHLFTANDKLFFKKQYLADSSMVLQDKDLYCFGQVSVNNLEISREYKDTDSEDHSISVPTKKTVISVSYDISVYDTSRLRSGFMESRVVKQAIKSNNAFKRYNMALINDISNYGWIMKMSSVHDRDYEYSDYIWIQDLNDIKKKENDVEEQSDKKQ